MSCVLDGITWKIGEGTYLAVGAGAVDGVSLSRARHGGCFVGCVIALGMNCGGYNKRKGGREEEKKRGEGG